ncbi:porin family protein [Thiohalorhabdus methylotrophus]|uniref:Porin family protein n=1 Tax=Thiohalorhabdus methylotrophus TaxID=3242694 RepID=A0ABV4TWX1_9GAMM
MGYQKRLIATATGVLLAAGTATAQAAEDVGPGWRGVYFGAGVGQYSYKQEGEVGGIDYSLDESDTAYKAFLGYRFTPYVSIEAAYADLGNPAGNLTEDLGGNRLKADTEAWYGYLVGYLPIANAFDFFGKVGVADWSVNAKLQGDGFESEIDNTPDGTDFAWGLGAEVNLPLNFSVRAEYERIEMGEGPLKNLDNELISASVLWQF